MKGRHSRRAVRTVGASLRWTGPMPSQLGVGLRRADLEGPGLGGSLSLEARDSAAPTLPSSLSLWSLDQPPRLSLVFGPLHGLICMSTNWSLRVSFHPNAALGERAVGSAAPSRASCLARPLSFGSHPLPSPLGEFAYLAHALSAWVDSHAPLANDDAPHRLWLLPCAWAPRTPMRRASWARDSAFVRPGAVLFRLSA